MKKREFFKVEGDRISRIRKHCPKCGPGVFLAEHKNRFSCGKCGYTEFKSGGTKESRPPKVEEKPIKQVTQEQETTPEIKEESKGDISIPAPETQVEEPSAEEKPTPEEKPHGETDESPEEEKKSSEKPTEDLE